MTREKLIQWSWDKCITVGNDPDISDGRCMAIVPDWATVESDNWKPFCECFENLDSDNFGFADEYTTCSECGRIIRTSPDGYGWKPDFWLNLDQGEITCSECLAECHEEYLDWLAEREEPTECIVSEDTLSEYGFTRLLQGLAGGLHEEGTDNPTAIYEYLKDKRLEIAFVVSSGQFTTGFDVYVRYGLDLLGLIDTESLRVPEEIIQALRASMVRSTFESLYGNTDTLNTEFANSYTARMCKAALKANIAELRQASA